MFRIITTAIAALALGTLSHSLNAQCAQIANTGCPQSQPARCVSEPRLGSDFTVRCHPCNGQQAAFVIVGSPLSTPITLGSPTTCDGARCGLGCNPLFVLFPENGLTVSIPNNPRFLGTQLCVQCGCLELVRPLCLELAPAVRATVQQQ